MKIKRIISGLLCLSLMVAPFGCGGGGGSTPASPVITDQVPRPLMGQIPAILSPAKDHSGDVDLDVGPDGKPSGVYSLPSAQFAAIGAGLLATPDATAVSAGRNGTLKLPKEIPGMDYFVAADIIFGLGVDIFDWISGSSEQDKQDEEFKKIEGQLTTIEGQISALSAQLALGLDKNWASEVLTTDQAAVFTTTGYALNTDYVGSTKSAFTYFSYQASLINQCMKTTGYPASCTPYQQDAYNNRPNLKGDAAFFAQQVIGTYDVYTKVGDIHKAILPGKTRILRAMANYVLTKTQATDLKTGYLDQNPAHNAMYAYLLLENMFSQLLSYQFQGAAMYVNTLNYQDSLSLTYPTLFGRSANNYMTGSFEQYLREEVAEFLAEVDYLAINLHDYRDQDIYGQAMQFAKQGLATDSVFSDVLARSRFFCAQLLYPFNYNRAHGGNGTYPPYNAPSLKNEVGHGFGLQGSIIVPWDYTKGNQITLNFTNTTTNVPYSYTATNAAITGRVPYTKWGGSYGASATPAYDYLAYDIDLSTTDLPAGTYMVQYAENGQDPNGQIGPWVHSDSTLGTVEVRYYNLKNPSDISTSKDSNHAVKFGYFSLYWPWNYQRISNSLMNQWTIWTAATKWVTVSPTKDFSGPINQMTFDTHQNQIRNMIYEMQLPFNVGVADNKTTQVTLVYFNQWSENGNTKAYDGFSNVWAGYGFAILGPSNKQVWSDGFLDPHVVPEEHDDFAGRLVTWNWDSQDSRLLTGGISMNNGEYYDIDITQSYKVKTRAAGETPVSDGHIDLTWSAQLLFQNTKSVIDIQE